MAEWRKMAIWACLLTALALVSGCVANGPTRSSDMHASGRGDRIAAISKQLVGSPYRFGGESPAGFDCSGLVRYVYRQIGITVPHSSKQLHRQSQKISLGDLQPGDLLFFRISEKKVSHVGIYTSEGEFIHAPSSGKSVSVANLDNPYWEKKLIAAGRFH